VFSCCWKASRTCAHVRVPTLVGFWSYWKLRAGWLLWARFRGLGVGQRMWQFSGVSRPCGSFVLYRVEFVRGVRVGRVQRRAADLGADEDRFLLLDGDSSQASKLHPDDAQRLVGPPTVQAGSDGRAGSTPWFICEASAVLGFGHAVLEPIQSRGMPTGRGGNRNASMRQRRRMPPLVCRMMSSMAFPTVSRCWRTPAPAGLVGDLRVEVVVGERPHRLELCG